MNEEQLEQVRKRLGELRVEWKLKPLNRKVIEKRAMFLKIILKRNEKKELL